MRRMVWALIVCIGVLAAGVSSPLALASSHKEDARLARQALESGEILPLRTLLERLEADYPGQVLEVELEREKGQWVYELKLLQPSGQLLELHVDARDARVMKVKDK